MTPMKYKRTLSKGKYNFGTLKIGNKLIASCVAEKTAKQIVDRYNREEL